MKKATGKSLNQNKSELANLFNTQKNDKDNHEEVIINWQTKIFSKSEYVKYSGIDFEPTNVLEEHYKDECLKLK